MFPIKGPVLAVVAHPDDESLGCGGTLWQAAEAGYEVGCCILSANAAARTRRPQDNELEEDTIVALKHLGVERIYSGTFPNIKFNTVPHLEMVQFVESAVRDLRPDVIITHHPSDLNIDHQHTAHAALAAARLPQRDSDASYVSQVLLMETLSATDWSYRQLGPTFVPECFVELGEEGLEAKLQAVRAYRGVMRPYPHPRSEEAIRAQATLRGAESHLYYAEAFEVAFSRNRVSPR
ncbi:MAG: PIG-L deacetylase family protein [Actinomycetota bacterium]